jgi:hypothetical protein
LDGNNHVQIAGNAASRRLITFASQFQALVLFYAGRNVDR